MNFSFCPCCASALRVKWIDARERQVCSNDCGFVRWNNPVPVVAGLIVYAGRALLVRQSNWPEKWFGLVTGFLEEKEEPADAIAREIREELGLHAQKVSWIGEFAFPEQNQLILAYAVACEGELLCSAEISEFKLIELSDLRPWPFGTGKAVKAWLEQRAAP